MTKQCEWCKGPVIGGPVGRPPQFCRRSCRQRAYEARRRSLELGLSDDELVVTRNELADLRDRLLEVVDAMGDATDAIDDGIDASSVLTRLMAQLEATLSQNQ